MAKRLCRPLFCCCISILVGVIIAALCIFLFFKIPSVELNSITPHPLSSTLEGTALSTSIDVKLDVNNKNPYQINLEKVEAKGYPVSKPSYLMAEGVAQKLTLISHDVTIVKFPLTFYFDVVKDLDVAKEVITNCLTEKPLELNLKISIDVKTFLRTITIPVDKKLDVRCPFNSTLLNQVKPLLPHLDEYTGTVLKAFQKSLNV